MMKPCRGRERRTKAAVVVVVVVMGRGKEMKGEVEISLWAQTNRQAFRVPTL